MAQGFEFGLTDLRRTQGAHRDFERVVDLDETLRSGLVQVPAGTPITVAGTMESVGDGVLVDSTVTARAQAQCSRCLTDFEFEVETQFQELFVYPERAGDYSEDTEEEISFITAEAIDLTQAVHDAIILDLPLIPLCRPDCRGLCPTCGADLNKNPEHSHGDPIDSRWLGLAEWGKMS